MVHSFKGLFCKDCSGKTHWFEVYSSNAVLVPVIIPHLMIFKISKKFNTGLIFTPRDYDPTVIMNFRY